MLPWWNNVRKTNAYKREEGNLDAYGTRTLKYSKCEKKTNSRMGNETYFYIRGKPVKMKTDHKLPLRDYQQSTYNIQLYKS